MLRALVATLLLLALPSPASAQQRGPSTAEERKRAVEATRRLEREPLARSSMEARKWLFQWIVEIPDIHVTSCSGPLDVLGKEDDDPYAQILYVQSVFGMAAFLIENPKKTEDWVAVQTAGVESVLRTYQALQRADSQARWKQLDRLVAAQKSGKLRAIVQKETKCGGDDEMGPAPRDAI